MFLEARIAKHPFYTDFLSAVSQHQDESDKPRVMDIGCCYGTDVRKLILDGVPPSHITAVDLHPGYWDMGKKLFQHGDERRRDQIQGVRTVFGDMAGPINTAEEDIVDVQRLAATQHFASAIAVLHVFGREQCNAFLRRVARCLVKGGVFYGTTAGAKDQATEWKRMHNDAGTPAAPVSRFLHSLDSLKGAMEEAGFGKVRVWLDERDGTDRLPNGSDGIEMITMLFVAEK